MFTEFYFFTVLAIIPNEKQMMTLIEGVSGKMTRQQI